jgi:vancomycin permeability regulator SanA
MTVDRADEVLLIRLFFRIALFLLILAIILPLYFFGKTWWTARDLAAEYDLTQVDFASPSLASEVIVVLGAAQFDGKPGPILKARLKTALAGYQANLAPAIMTVGDGAPGDRTTEAESGKAWLVSKGVPKSRVIAITEGRDTYASTLGYTAAMKDLGLESALITTDPYHCLRAMTMAKDQGIKAQCLPTAFGLANLENSSLRYLVREAGAYLAYVTLGRRGIMIDEERIDGLLQ